MEFIKQALISLDFSYTGCKRVASNTNFVLGILLRATYSLVILLSQ